MMLSPAHILAAVTAFNVTSAPDLFDGFAEGWRQQWQEQRLFARPTQYDTVRDGGQLVLHARSETANAGLLRKVWQPAPTHGRLSWRWKIQQPLTANPGERSRAGDDYAARVFVVFETSLLPLQTRAINYVWAAHEPVGAVFASPHTGNVAMIVLRSGATEAGTWQMERRDVLADYRAFFGEAPRSITAVAVLVDTDHAGLLAEARFADLRLTTILP